MNRLAHRRRDWEPTAVVPSPAIPIHPKDRKMLPLESLEGKYEIVAKIREGGMGTIYKVRHRLLDEMRVVKVLHPQYEHDEELKERFLREARSAIQLRHPNVVQIFDFSLDPSGTGLLVMEHIPGSDWRRLIRGGRRPSLALALEMARQTLLALGYLHRGGFVHRDVSPDNLMLALDHERKPLVKLIDLGIAKSLKAKQLTATGSFLGKFRYSSPEHFGGASHGGAGPRSDLYTFALVLYELLTGVYPMAADDTSQLISAHLFRPPRSFDDTDPEGSVPPEIRSMVLRALAKKPEERYPNAEVWASQIEVLQRQWPVDERVCGEVLRWLDAETKRDESSWNPGSTQSKLDRNFGFEPTPRPAADDPAAKGQSTEDQSAEGRGLEAQDVADQGRDDRTRTLLEDGELGGDDPRRAQGHPPARAGFQGSQQGGRDKSGAGGDRVSDDDFAELFQKGVKAVLLRDYESALADFEAAERLRPGDPKVVYNLARLRHRS